MTPVATLIETFRTLTGRLSASHLTDTEALAALNNFYQNVFPTEARIVDFSGWHTFQTEASQATYSVPEGTALRPPAFLDGSLIKLTTDFSSFHQVHPSTHSAGQPVAILIDGDTLTLGPKPDGAYAVKIRINSSTPAALTANGEVESMWSNAIAYGAAIMFLIARGNTEAANRHAPALEVFMKVIRINDLKRRFPEGTRPPGDSF